MSAKYNGEVVKWKERPGYGFIRTDGPNAADIFFHHKYLPMQGYKTIKPGTRVEFELGENDRGPMAINIRLTTLPDGTFPDEYDDGLLADDND